MPDAASGRTFEVPIGDERAVEDVSPEVSRIANSIGFALAERGVQFTAADATAAAQRVFDQLGHDIQREQARDEGRSR